MTDEIVLLSLPKIELKALIIDCLATVLEDYQPAPAAAPQNAVFDVEGLTQYAGLSKDTIYRKAGRGEIPHSKQGRKLYFEKSQIDAWLMANKVTPEAIAARAEAYEKKKAAVYAFVEFLLAGKPDYDAEKLRPSYLASAREFLEGEAQKEPRYLIF